MRKFFLLILGCIVLFTVTTIVSCNNTSNATADELETVVLEDIQASDVVHLSVEREYHEGTVLEVTPISIDLNGTYKAQVIVYNDAFDRIDTTNFEFSSEQVIQHGDYIKYYSYY